MEVRLEAEIRVKSRGSVSERDWTFCTKMVHEDWTAPMVSETCAVANGAVYMAVKRVKNKVAERVLLLMGPGSAEIRGEEP